jgi:hypothetical protein
VAGALLLLCCPAPLPVDFALPARAPTLSCPTSGAVSSRATGCSISIAAELAFCLIARKEVRAASQMLVVAAADHDGSGVLQTGVRSGVGRPAGLSLVPSTFASGVLFPNIVSKQTTSCARLAAMADAGKARTCVSLSVLLTGSGSLPYPFCVRLRRRHVSMSKWLHDSGGSAPSHGPGTSKICRHSPAAAASPGGHDVIPTCRQISLNEARLPTPITAAALVIERWANFPRSSRVCCIINLRCGDVTSLESLLSRSGCVFRRPVCGATKCLGSRTQFAVKLTTCIRYRCHRPRALYRGYTYM